MDLTKSPRLPAILLAASRVSLLLRFQRNVETLWNRWDENQNVGKLFLALISSVRSRGVSKSWRIRRMKRRRKQKGKQWGKERTRQRQRATYTRRWITHDCLAWNYSISPPLARTTDYPLPCSLRFHSIMHPASPTSHPPLRSYYYFSSARDLAPTTSFLAKPVDGRQRETKQGEPETRSSRLDIPPPPPPLPLVAKSGLTRLFLRKIRPQGRGRGKRDRWPPFVLVEVEATVNEKRRICIDPIQEFTFSLFFVSDGRWSFSVRDSKCWSRR